MNLPFTIQSKEIFRSSISAYHLLDDVDQPFKNPYPEKSIENLLYKKNWIDTVQWHLEDLIRDPEIDPTEALKIKRRIDSSNQDRTDLVEIIDEYFLHQFKDVKALKDASLNTETPAWAIDRFSILQLKIYHWEQEANRTDTSIEQLAKAGEKLAIMQEQEKDLSQAIENLLHELTTGQKVMKLYRQMKMYNDPMLNPVLYKSTK